jgi:hypothetical protein
MGKLNVSAKTDFFRFSQRSAMWGAAEGFNAGDWLTAYPANHNRLGLRFHGGNLARDRPSHRAVGPLESLGQHRL